MSRRLAPQENFVLLGIRFALVRGIHSRTRNTYSYVEYRMMLGATRYYVICCWAAYIVIRHYVKFKFNLMFGKVLYCSILRNAKNRARRTLTECS